MSLWTVQQHEWLRALGHPVLLLAGDPALVVAAPVVAAPPPAVVAPAPPRPQPAPGLDERSRPPAPRRAPPAAGLPGPLPDGVDAVAVAVAVANANAIDTPRADAAVKKAALAAARGARRETPPMPTPLAVDDPLLQAILRASGLDADAFEASARSWQLDLARLRAQPLSKRALWLQMRGKGRKPTR